ncbi:ABC transporter substrate-binding protein [Sinimarinibacterium sp. CAU 1509]|uniref:CmpA/NrtA family ABC transporter substrate-binding protein n=1 Tax=Sinimarinibacterium sp. CAU 1509 TaxID=2562283 RepID=UPI0010ABFB5E|nr:CmpA/NrtA family ABC transporter substrate-binding protein [Sinimarinibacterium sp. CAU 1509]TJY58172.1 ABC transporter substrate-binding protein [Sinimarinibacterium sp. CAU 1509]
MSETLEKKKLRLGVVPLADAAPIIVARDKGFFEMHGLQVSISVEASWASIRDKLVAGILDGAQMLAPMPIAATLGLDGLGTPMVTALSLNLNGNSIAVSERLYRELHLQRRDAAAAGRALKDLLIRDRLTGRGPRVFAHVFPFSTHHYELRYWLAASGIDPDHDVRLEVVPPQLMVHNLRDGRIDGFCAGAPWGAVAEIAGSGYRIVNTYQIWNNAPEKVLGVTRDWADANPTTHRALVAALIDACRWLDAAEHRAEGAQLLIDSEVLEAPPAAIRAALDIPVAGDPFFGPGLAFHAGAANFPWVSHAQWFIEQMQRWGQVPADVDAAAVAAKVYLPALYRQAAASLKITSPLEDSKTEGQHDGDWSLEQPSGAIRMGADRFFDGSIFDPGVSGLPR